MEIDSVLPNEIWLGVIEEAHKMKVPLFHLRLVSKKFCQLIDRFLKHKIDDQVLMDVMGTVYEGSLSALNPRCLYLKAKMHRQDLIPSALRSAVVFMEYASKRKEIQNDVLYEMIVTESKNGNLCAVKAIIDGLKKRGAKEYEIGREVCHRVPKNVSEWLRQQKISTARMIRSR